LESQFESSIITIFKPDSSRVPTNGLLSQAQLCLEKLRHVGIVGLEARVDEASVFGFDAAAGAPQLGHVVDHAGGDKVRDLGEVAARPGKADRKGLDPRLVAPLDSPAPAARVADREARLRSGGGLFEEGERRDRRVLGAAGPVNEIEGFDRARVAPDAMMAGAQAGRPGPPHKPDADRPQHAAADHHGGEDGSDARPIHKARAERLMML
jgi:hypothetical protein